MKPNDGGYLLPEVINPERISFCIQIPNDLNHILAFWGALNTLTWSKNWQKDEAHTAALVARVWDDVIAQARVQFNLREECMPFDPCCPETNDLLQQLVTLNQTIVENQTTIINNQVVQIDNSQTIIDNSETVIEQNYDQQMNNYTQQFENWTVNNQTVNTLNQMLYDGTPQSIASNLGENFNSAGGDDALCGAINRYTENIISEYTAGVNTAAWAAGAIGAAVGAIIVGATLGAAAPFVGAWGLILGGAAGASLAVWNVAQADLEARLKVRCCMFESLKDQPITFENFNAAVQDCGFDPTTNEGRIAGLIQDNATEANYLAFLRNLGQGNGNASDCSCCDVQLVATNDCIVTPLGDCRWHIVQTHGVHGGGDPFCTDGYTYYTAQFKDQFDRCIDIVSSSGTAMSGWTQIDCEDVEHSGVGGGGGQGKLFTWQTKACPPDATYMDIIVEAVLVE